MLKLFTTKPLEKSWLKWNVNGFIQEKDAWKAIKIGGGTENEINSYNFIF